MSNELTKSDWGYIVPTNSKTYNNFYKGNWKVVKTFDNMVQLSQSDSTHGDGYYTHSKKNIIIPMTQFQNNFKKVRAQNIIVEDKPVEEEQVVERNKPQAAPRPSPVMTNKDIQKSIDERKKSWSDEDIENYLKSRGIVSKKDSGRGESEENGARKAIDALESVFNDAFGPGVTSKLLNLFHAGVNWKGIKDDCPVGPNRDYPESYERKLYPAVEAFQRARDEFGKIMHRFDPFEDWYPGNGGVRTPDKAFEPKRPCRYTQEYTEEPRCEEKDCKRCKRRISIY
jgi:hypothetical protein